MTKKKTVSALVAAYNEEANIANVLSELVKYHDFQEIIVVDDGSSDNTFAEISKFPVTAIRLPKNKGKSEAVKAGLEKAAPVDVFFLCDADIIGFKVEYARDIIEPVIDGRLHMHMGQRSKFSPLIDKLLSLIRTQWISGERAIEADILKQASLDQRFKGFMMETVINAYVKRMGKKKQKLLDTITGIHIKQKKMAFGRA